MDRVPESTQQQANSPYFTLRVLEKDKDARPKQTRHYRTEVAKMLEDHNYNAKCPKENSCLQPIGPLRESYCHD